MFLAIPPKRPSPTPLFYFPAYLIHIVFDVVIFCERSDEFAPAPHFTPYPSSISLPPCPSIYLILIVFDTVIFCERTDKFAPHTLPLFTPIPPRPALPPT